MSEPPRFVPTPHPEVEPTDPEARRSERLDKTLAEIGTCLDDAARLVSMGKQNFDESWMVKRAAKNIVSELAATVSRLPESFRLAHHEVPWRAMSGMRNRVVHVYQHVDPEIVWNVLATDLPAVRSHLEQNRDAGGAKTPGPTK